MEYQIQVTFFRNLADDAGVIGVAKPTKAQLTQQFRQELQQAYDASGMAGRWVINKIDMGG